MPARWVVNRVSHGAVTGWALIAFTGVCGVEGFRDQSHPYTLPVIPGVVEG